jgi:PAS domain-containing protein
MTESGSSDGNLPERLQGSLRRLEETIRSFRVRGVHFVPDLVILGLGRDVFENAQASLLLARSEVPRAGNACARSALEGALDLLFLANRPDDTYDLWGARARAAEILDREHAAELASRVDSQVPEGVTDGDLTVDVNAMIEAEATVWESRATGKGAILQTALENVRADRKNRKWHWTGYRRGELLRKIYDEPEDDPHSFVAVVTSWYNLLSIEAHPAPRIFADQLEIREDGTISVKVTPGSAEEHARMTNVGVGAAFVAAEATSGVLAGFTDEDREER